MYANRPLQHAKCFSVNVVEKVGEYTISLSMDNGAEGIRDKTFRNELCIFKGEECEEEATHLCFPQLNSGDIALTGATMADLTQAYIWCLNQLRN